jgi:ubiquinone/menaquinone biosynthesis C-methylase UbiE
MGEASGIAETAASAHLWTGVISSLPPTTPYLMESPREGDRLEAKTDPEVAARHLRWSGLRLGMRALDAACGTGAVTRIMAAIAMSGSVVGIDMSPPRLAQARQLASRRRAAIEFIAGDAYQLPVSSAQFDFTWSRFLFEYLAEPQRALAELIRVTRPGGTVAVADLDGQITQLFPVDSTTQRELVEAVRLLRRTGFDPHVGRKLYAWCYAAGLQDIAVHVEPHQVYTGGLPARDAANWHDKLTTVAAHLSRQTGDEARWLRLRDALLGQLHRPDTFYYSTLILVRGTVPTS